MSSSKACKNLAEEDRRQKALKKEKKAFKKWKWTTIHNEQSFKKEDQHNVHNKHNKESFKKEDQLVKGLFRKDDKGLDLAAKISAQEDKGYMAFKILFQRTIDPTSLNSLFI